MPSIGMIGADSGCPAGLMRDIVLIPGRDRGAILGKARAAVSGVVILLAALAIVRPAQAVDTTENLMVRGIDRTFLVHVPPSYDGSTPVPLLFMFHGLKGTAAGAASSYYNWEATSDANNFIVLFPESLDGLDLVWPADPESDKHWDVNMGSSDSQDLDFVSDMISWATANYNIRTSHIFTTGHSYGAYFSYYTAVHLSDDIAAFGEHSGGLAGGGFWPTQVPTGNPKVNGILIHSTGDSVVAYSSSEDLYNALTSNGHTADFVTLPGAMDHGWDNTKNQQQWDFFMAHAANTAPVIDSISASPSILTTDGSTTCMVAAHDPDNDPLTYAWSKQSGPGSVAFGTPAANSSTASFTQAGAYQLQVIVSDGSLTATDAVSITVLDPAADPDLDGLTNAEEIAAGTNPNSDDTDGDGMPDGWEVANSLDPLVDDAGDDPDTDGLTNAEEYAAGTDPNDADTDDDLLPDGYEVTNSLDPLDPADGNADGDTDGLTDGEEYVAGTDPGRPDSDDDGMPDGWEVAGSLDPLVDDTGGDADGDGLTNAEEYAGGTEPDDADTDGDGMPDGWEAENDLDPLENDASGDPDGDEFTNFEEYLNGTDPRVKGEVGLLGGGGGCAGGGPAARGSPALLVLVALGLALRRKRARSALRAVN